METEHKRGQIAARRHAGLHGRRPGRLAVRFLLPALLSAALLAAALGSSAAGAMEAPVQSGGKNAGGVLARPTLKDGRQPPPGRARLEPIPPPPAAKTPAWEHGADYTELQKAIADRLAATDRNRDGKPIGPTLRERFYREGDCRPAWAREGIISTQVRKLTQLLKEAEQEGLNPEDYQVTQIETLTDRLEEATRAGEAVRPETWAEWDILLTDAFLRYGRHVSEGRLDPAKWFYQWVPYRRTTDLVEVLTEALKSGDVEGALRRLPPRYPAYGQLRTELAKYRLIAAQGGWRPIPEKLKLRRGSAGEAVNLLRRRLLVDGDLDPAASGKSNRFDRELEAALQRFQRRHGLRESGVVDEDTRKALNFAVEKRIRQIEWNMERWRWLPDELGPRYIMVNIPDFRLFAVENQVTVMSMKTVVGKASQPTPVFMDNMSYLELNPTWNVPNSIVAEEMIPKAQKDPEFLGKKRIRLYSNWSPTAKEIDPKTIDWRKVNPKRFPYRMIQDSGVNPLGRIKFMFPNQFDVYLHDTTQKSLFQRPRRMYSHGCIRVEKPFELGAWVLKDDPAWSQERLVGEIRKGKRQQVNLSKPLPVYVIYLTAWFDTRGHIHFRDDIYDYDKSLEKVLEQSSGTAVRLLRTANPL
ncbi:MAG: L,D-transpeptidase family protein [Pseudomonadota bacterium]|nr:L,D-transpeptidase family protein [Pseudomonadota bacterium]